MSINTFFPGLARLLLQDLYAAEETENTAQMKPSVISLGAAMEVNDDMVLVCSACLGTLADSHDEGNGRDKYITGCSCVLCYECAKTQCPNIMKRAYTDGFKCSTCCRYLTRMSIITSCGHVFCRHCWQEGYIQQTGSCPLCRQISQRYGTIRFLHCRPRTLPDRMTDRCKAYCKKNGWDCPTHRRFYNDDVKAQLAQEVEENKKRWISARTADKLRRFCLCVAMAAIWVRTLMRVLQDMQAEI